MIKTKKFIKKVLKEINWIVNRVANNMPNKAHEWKKKSHWIYHIIMMVDHMSLIVGLKGQIPNNNQTMGAKKTMTIEKAWQMDQLRNPKKSSNNSIHTHS